MTGLHQKSYMPVIIISKQDDNRTIFIDSDNCDGGKNIRLSNVKIIAFTLEIPLCLLCIVKAIRIPRILSDEKNDKQIVQASPYDIFALAQQYVEFIAEVMYWFVTCEFIRVASYRFLSRCSRKHCSVK